MGDLIGPYLYAKMNGGIEPKLADPNGPTRFFLTCGSILQPQLVKPTTVVWGSGIIERNVHFRQKPAAIHAVRGPISRQILLKSRIACPEIYGDPGLLLPRFYTPKKTQFPAAVGIVPHYVDYEFMKTFFAGIDGIRIIDMDRSVEAVCDDICGCGVILSSSLHGLVVAHAYGIACAWMTTKHKLWGDNVKYHDYYASLGICDGSMKPIEYQALTKLTGAQLAEIVAKYPQPRQMPNLDLLLAACPFGAGKNLKSCV